jgi:hypothetical protein
MLSDNCQSVNKVLLDAELLSPRHQAKIKKNEPEVLRESLPKSPTRGQSFNVFYVTPSMHRSRPIALPPTGRRFAKF